MRQTSLEAFESLNYQKLLTERQMQVFSAIIYLNGATNLEVSKFLNWPINCVTPRTRELFMMKKVVEDGERLFVPTHKHHTIWKVKK